MKILFHKIRFKYFFLIFLLSFLISSPKAVFAEWTKYSGNPILAGTPGGWDSRDAHCNNLFINQNLFKMWYSGNNGSGWRIGYAFSNDGKSNWIKEPSYVIDIGSSDGWERDQDDPFVLIEGTIYKMWYLSIGPNWISGPDRFRIRYAESNDGISWSEYPNWIIYGTQGNWDAGGIARGKTILKINSTYQLWYAGTDTGFNWKIGYATSPDGIEWTKQNEGQPVIIPTEDWELNNVSYPNVIFENGFYQMWYAAGAGDMPSQIVYATSTDGIHWDKPADKNPVFGLGSSGSWDDVGLASPFVLKQGNTYKMWYSGYDGSNWRIGYAENELPAPAHLQPLILLPGLGASWNYQKMILGTDQPQSQWFMTPGIKVYDGLIETLKNAGYQTEGAEKNLFVYNYDWSKPVATSADELKQYLQNVVAPPPGEKIDLIGHSLGGLIARTYLQNNSENQIDQLLTLGSPHHGAVQTYYPWEGGDIHFMPSWQRIGIGLMLYLRKSLFSGPKDTIQSVAPVIKDLLPDFNYLKRGSAETPVGDMTEKNKWLISLNSSLPNYLLNKLNPFVGQIPDSTLRWISVNERNWLDILLGLWPDGKPAGETQSAEGDSTVLSESAVLAGTNIINLPDLNHGQLVSSISGQQKIMEILNLTPTEISDISEGLNYEPALIFLIASPAKIEVIGPDNKPAGYGDGKLIIIPNASAGNYQINLTGQVDGEYKIYFGQLTVSQDLWTTLAGTITANQNLSHQINFQPDKPNPNPWIDPQGNDYLKSGQTKLAALKEQISNSNYRPLIKKSLLFKLNEVFKFIQNNRTEKAVVSLYEFRLMITGLYRTRLLSAEDARLLKNQIQEIINDLEQVYVIKETNKGGSYPVNALKKEILVSQKILKNLENKLKTGHASVDAGATYLLAQEKLNQAQVSSSFSAHIKALGAQYLAQEGFLL